MLCFDIKKFRPFLYSIDHERLQTAVRRFRDTCEVIERDVNWIETKQGQMGDINHLIRNHEIVIPNYELMIVIMN